MQPTSRHLRYPNNGLLHLLQVFGKSLRVYYNFLVDDDDFYLIPTFDIALNPAFRSISVNLLARWAISPFVLQICHAVIR